MREVIRARQWGGRDPELKMRDPQGRTALINIGPTTRSGEPAQREKSALKDMKNWLDQNGGGSVIFEPYK